MPTNSTRSYKKLCDKIEELVPEAGFYKKGCPIDFSFEDILYALDKKYPETFCYQPTLGLIEFVGVRGTLPLNKRDYIRTAVYFSYGESLSWIHTNDPMTFEYLYNLLCSK